MSNFKLCPFCKAELNIYSSADRIIGIDCDCIVAPCLIINDLAEEGMLEKVWNTRPLEDELQAENAKLRKAILETLEENGHLADGEDCTLIKLKRAIYD